MPNLIKESVMVSTLHAKVIKVWSVKRRCSEESAQNSYLVPFLGDLSQNEKVSEIKQPLVT